MMLHDSLHFRRSIAFALLAGSFAVIAAGCSNTENVSRARTLSSPAARTLVGVWQVSFWLGRLSTPNVAPGDSAAVLGTIAFDEDSHGLVSTDGLSDATHGGVYDVDFSPFGFETRSSGEFPEAIARVFPSQWAQVSKDSLSIVLGPHTRLFSVWMSGQMNEDSVTGFWTAAANRSGGISGRFKMTKLRSGKPY